MSEAVGVRGPYPALVTYLLVADAPALVAFLEAAFGAVLRFAAPSDTGGITHGEIALGDSVLMISDSADAPRTAISICHYVADTDAVYAQAMAAGATSVRAPVTEHYGDRVAGVTDPAGNSWWICTVLRET
jgi:uncharacterized glyoxalase superfamily protein PhnB